MRNKILSLIMTISIVVGFIPVVASASAPEIYNIITSESYANAEIWGYDYECWDDGNRYAFFQFSPEETATYYFYTANEVYDDTHAILLDGNGNKIDYDDNSLDDYLQIGFELSHTLVAGETYYFGAGYVDSSMCGTFYVCLARTPIEEAYVDMPCVNPVSCYDNYTELCIEHSNPDAKLFIKLEDSSEFTECYNYDYFSIYYSQNVYAYAVVDTAVSEIFWNYFDVSGGYDPGPAPDPTEVYPPDIMYNPTEDGTQMVEIIDNFGYPEGQIYYSLDGETFEPYWEPFVVSETTTVWAYMWTPMGESMWVSCEVYVDANTLTEPDIVSTYSEDETYVTVEISDTSTLGGAQIYYSLDNVSYQLYSNPLTFYEPTQIYAYAENEGVQSDIATKTVGETLVAPPTINNPLDVLGGKSITITSKHDYDIYYSLDDINYEKYTEPIFASYTSTIYAYCMSDNRKSATKTIDVEVSQALEPSASLESGAYTKQDVSFSADSGLDIYYKTTIGDVTSEYTKYTTPITIDKDFDITVYAIGMGIASSQEVTYSYTLKKAEKPTFVKTDIMGGIKLQINCESEAAKIYYSTDGETYQQYTEPLEFNNLAKVYTYTTEENCENSDILVYDVTMPSTMTPTPNYASGAVFKGTNITLESVNSDRETQIYYTLDNSDPKLSGEGSTRVLYTSGIEINSPVTIKAVAYSMGGAVSEVAELKYTIRTAVAPTINEKAVYGGKEISLSTTTPDALMYYYVGDENSTPVWALYKTPFIVSTSGSVVRAYAAADKYLDSSISKHTVEIGAVDMPKFDVTDETIYLNTQISFTAQDFVKIYYTTDGTDPTISGEDATRKEYTQPFTIDDNTTIKVYAMAQGWQNSAINEKTYKVYQTAKPTIVKTVVGNYIKIEFKSETPDATIYYTTNGSDPTIYSTQYTTPFMIEKDTSFKVYAVSSNRKDSEILQTSVFVKHTAAPKSNFESGYIKTTDKITLTGDEGATIYYTTDGTDPTTQSTVYTEPFTISADTTVKAFATLDEYLDSDIVTYEYKIRVVKNPVITWGDDVLGGKTVKISCEDADAKIYYTTNGTDPTIYSSAYTGSFVINKTQVVKVIAVADGCKNSAVTEVKMTVPVADIDFITSSNVKIGDVIYANIPEGVTVYYTVDGTTPTAQSSVFESGKLVCEDDFTLTYYAQGVGYATCEVKGRSFNIIRADHDVFYYLTDNGAMVCIHPTDYNLNTKFYYTTDGTEADETSTPYTEPFEILEDCVLSVCSTAHNCKSVTRSWRADAHPASVPSYSISGTYLEKDLTEYSSYDKNIAMQLGETITLTSNGEIDYSIIKAKADEVAVPSEDGKSVTITVTKDMTIYAHTKAYGEYGRSYPISLHVSVLNAKAAVTTKDIIGGKTFDIEAIICDDDDSMSNELNKTNIAYAIYYTTDGSDPMDKSNQAVKIFETSDGNIKTDPVFINKTTTVRAYVEAENCISKDPAMSEITVKKLAPPAANPTTSTVLKGTYVILSDSTADARIYYTLNNTTPTTESTQYQSPIQLNDDTTIKAIAVLEGYVSSDVTELTYTIAQAKTPVFNKTDTASGTIVEIECETEGADIYYTLNNEDPTSENAIKYTEPFKLTKNTIVKAIAIHKDMKDSYVNAELINVASDIMQLISIPDVEVKAGEEITIPVSVKNNPGISAYSISVEYDNAVLTPVSAKNNWGGIFVTNIGKEDSNSDKAVSVTWLGNNSTYADDTIFNLTFKANEDTLVGDTTDLVLKHNGIINHLFEDVDIVFDDGSATINEKNTSLLTSSLYMSTQKSTIYTETELSLKYEKVDDDTLNVNVFVDENYGFGAYNISLLYNNEVMQPVAITNGKLFESDVMSNVTQPSANLEELSHISLLSCNDTDVTANGLLCTVTFNLVSQNYVNQKVQYQSAQLFGTNGDEVVANYNDLTIEENTTEFELSPNEAYTISHSGQITDLEVNVTNNTTQTESGTVVAALYNSTTNKLVDISYIAVEEIKSGTNTIDGFVLSTKNNSDCIIKVFLWDSIQNMYPIAQAVQLTTTTSQAKQSIEAVLLSSFTVAESGEISNITAQAINNTQNPKKVSVLLAAYDKDTNILADSFNTTLTLEKGTNTIDNISLSAASFKNCKLKMYLWDDLKTMQPLSLSAQTE